MVDKFLGGVSGAFRRAKDLVILQTEDWVLNHRVDSALPGYLVLGARMPTNDLSLLRPEALDQLGTLFGERTKGPEYAAETRTPLYRALRPYGWPRTTLSSDTDLRMGEAALF
jgi:hypothetical protein